MEFRSIFVDVQQKNWFYIYLYINIIKQYD